jgi:low temperature requirement protein LtrA
MSSEEIALVKYIAMGEEIMGVTWEESHVTTTIIVGILTFIMGIAMGNCYEKGGQLNELREQQEKAAIVVTDHGR